VSVTRRRFAFLATLLVAVNVFFWLAQSGFALPGAGLVETLLGGRMIRAEVVWQGQDGKIHDTEVYRGVVVAVGANTITLRERDRPSDVIALSPTATVRFGLRTGTVSMLRPGERVVVAAPANEPADTVQIESAGG
jgi:hypothetical protein